MNCAVHADREAAGYCRNCGKPLCSECVRPVQGALYCENCLGAMVLRVPPVAASSAPSPGLAAFLGLVPGLGAVYNGDYNRALLHVGIWAGLFAMGLMANGSVDALIWVAFGFFPLFTSVDSYRIAKARAFLAAPHAASSTAPPASVPATPAMAAGAAPTNSAAFAGMPSDAPPRAAQRAARVPVGAVILIALGVFFFLAQNGWIREDMYDRGWPVILIAIGGWLLWKRTRGGSS